MKNFIPSSPIFYFCLIMGTMMSLSASHWLFLWIGMELNLFSFIPLIINNSNTISLEASIKYFLVQLFSSIMLITSMMSLFITNYSLSSLLMMFFFFMSIFTKLGIAPCHFWYPMIISALSWPMCFIMMTWQKIIPLFILMFILYMLPLKLMYLSVLLSSLVGGMGGMNQTQLRSLLAYSSISHMSWILSTLILSPLISFFYFLSYSFILFPLIYINFTLNISSNNQLFNLFSSSKLTFMIFSLSMLSLGGLPPLFGFFPKWLSMMLLLNKNMIFMILFLILGSLMNLYYYLMLIFPLMNFFNFKFMKIKLNKNFIFFFSFSFLGIIPSIYFSI
uniref:NADH-ubiquinone oxidoreductase chain 2 n=1 Tax=Galathealinum brachiosum TaxID=53701 RepID=A0A0E3DR84_9ANNE|nr:NADH dehydrogenase subunit 2 [Galathealinum brachiosum]AIL54808.1 NADH dehydrogenase subunit 2 [Galathealinum brachiosum]